MKIRPKVIPGDLVRLSKKILKYPKSALVLAGYLNRKFIVEEILDGDGIEGNSIIKCYSKDKNIYNPENEIFHFARKFVWKTGYNIFENENPNEIFLDQDAPLNNNGRNTCYVCHMSTKQIESFVDVFDLCKNPNCKWYEN